MIALLTNFWIQNYMRIAWQHFRWNPVWSSSDLRIFLWDLLLAMKETNFASYVDEYDFIKTLKENSTYSKKEDINEFVFYFLLYSPLRPLPSELKKQKLLIASWQTPWNTILDNDFKTGTIKTADTSDHFPIIFAVMKRKMIASNNIS